MGFKNRPIGTGLDGCAKRVWDLWKGQAGWALVFLLGKGIMLC